ncbi:MAG TPA: transposase [Tepidisphaeraceae bacterium]|nr:transposase [Tepidisphaeraceae bacterium]
MRRKAHYLLRLSKQMALLPKRIQRLGPDEWLAHFRPSADSRRRCPGLPAELICRLIRYQRPGFRPSWLLTSLMDTHLCSREELVDLYHRRWSIETIYREWKHSLYIQNLRSQTPRGILKEVYTQLMISNLTRWQMTEAAEGTDDAPVNLSFLAALTLERKAVSRIGRITSREYATLSARLLGEIRAAKIRKRPGRSYPRPGEGKIKNKGHGKFQQPARIMRKIA